MNKCPRIGDKVVFKGNKSIGSCSGTVDTIYKEREWDNVNQREGKLYPERDWHVGVVVVSLPAKWPYRHTNRFAPAVKEIELEKV